MNKHLVAAMMVLAIAAGTASADVIAEDSFLTPAGSEYDLGALNAQSPALTGFADGDAWDADDDSYNTFTVISDGLDYEGLASSGGAVRLDRNETTVITDLKDAVRASNGNAAGETVYFSALIQHNGASAQFGIKMQGKNVNWIGFDESGHLTLFSQSGGGGSSDHGPATSTATYSAVTHLLVAKLVDNGGGSGQDRLSVYIDPDLSGGEPTSANLTLDVGTAGFYPSNNGLDSIGLRGDNPGGQSTEPIFDELRVGDAWADVTPIPEPATMSLLAIGGLGALLRRKR